MKLEVLIFVQKAEAELAYELQAAKTKQRIKEENMQIKVMPFRDILYCFTYALWDTADA
jgi:hypothetical protein